MDAEDFKQYREAQQDRRKERLPIRQQEIEALKPEYEVKKLTEFQYRINGVIDLYPIHKRYHDLRNNKRGDYKSALEIINTLTK